MKIEVNIKPQNINALFKILSAKNPNIGCIRDEKMCDILKITVAIAIVIPSLAAINGIIGFKKPV